MATRILPLQSFLQLFQPMQSARQPLLSSPIVRRFLNPSISASPLAIPLAAFAGVSDILREIWDGLLRAVPKKKTSHAKKRHRQMAGKALKDVTHLSKCSACGRLKRMHVLCPHCVQAVRMWVKEKVLRTPAWTPLIPKNKQRPTYNLAEHSSEMWARIKEQRAKKAMKEAREQKARDDR